MATTIYSFQADLTQLLRLNRELENANATLLRLKANTAGYAATSKKLGTMTTAMDKTGKSMSKANNSAKALNTTGNRMVGIFKSASIAIASAFAFRAIIGSIRGVITSFSDFESQMSAVKAISGATDAEFIKLRSSAEKLGATTVFTATQVAQLQEEYARLGFSADEIVQAQAGTISLAAATGESLKSSAETAGSVIRAFGLEALDTGRIVDIMGASFTSSALNLERFSQSMKFVAPVAKAAGFTIEETSAMLAQLADNGLHGSIAGNALKNIMLRLGDANSKLNKKLGHTVQGLPQFTEALRGMKDGAFGLTDAVDLLDKRSAPAFLALLANIDGLEESLGTLNNAEGAVSRMAAIRLDNLQGDFTLLKSATEGLGIAVGEVFNISMRQSVDALTQWVQKLSASEPAMKTIRVAFNTLSNIIQAVIIRFAFLKAATIAQGLSIKGLYKGVRLLAISFRGLATTTMSASTAMKGFRAALASTGVGLLVVAIGTLVGYLQTLGKETAEVEMQMDRLDRAFNKDIEAVIVLNEENNERVDLLRKLNNDYPELIGNIDLETASNKELLEVLTFINDTRAERGLIEVKKELIKQLYEKLAVEQHASKVKQVQLQAERDLITSGDKITHQQALRAQAIDKETARLIKNRFIRKNNAKAEEKELLNDIKVYKKMIEDKQKASGDFVSLEVQEDNKFRKKLSDGYLKDLEEFRSWGDNKISIAAGHSREEREAWREGVKAKQQAEIDKTQAHADALANAVKYYNDEGKINFGSIEQIRKKQKAWNIFYSSLSKTEIEDIKKIKNIRETGIEVQELRKKLINLNTALIKSGKASNKSAISVDMLNTTKDRIKELLKLNTKAIVDINTRERAEINNTATARLEKYEKEKELIATNLSTIQTYATGVATNQDALNAKFIEKNKQKYDILKTTDAKGWDDLLASGQAGIDARKAMLGSMYQEEQFRGFTNAQIIIEIEKIKQRDLDIQANDFAASELNAVKSKFATQLAEMDKGALSIFRNNEETAKQIETIKLGELAITEENVRLGVLSTQEGEAAKMKIIKNASDQMNDLEDARLEKIKETYGQISAIIMEFSANRAEVEALKVETDAEKSMSIEQTKFDRQVEMAEKAGKSTIGMQKEHDIKMESMEEEKQNKLREIARKQFVIQKANDMAMAVINGALAITKVTAQTGVGAIVAAPLTSAIIAAQIGMIASRQFVGERGGVTPTSSNEGSLDKFATGGMVMGRSHAQGGEKFKAGGRVVELEGGEAVINKRSTAMFKPQLSAMNSHNGFGKKFAVGGMTPGTRVTMDSAKDNWTASDVSALISGAINSQQVYVTEADISTSQSVVNIIEGHSTIF